MGKTEAVVKSVLTRQPKIHVIWGFYQKTQCDKDNKDNNFDQSLKFFKFLNTCMLYVVADETVYRNIRKKCK